MQNPASRSVWLNLSILALTFTMPTLGFGAKRPSEPDREYSSSVVHKNVMIPMRDGVRLATDIYFPSEDGVKPASGRFPVMLVRTPYGKKPQLEYVDYIGAIGKDTSRGYIVVYQDVRGAHGSEGVLQPMVNEGPDGYDTVAWLAKQPWSDERIGTFFGSYPGGAQILLAAERPPHLVASFVEWAATDLFDSGWPYMDGALSGVAVDWSSWQALDAASRLPQRRRDLLNADFATLGIPSGGLEAMNAEDRSKPLNRMWNTLSLRDVPIVRYMPWWTEWLNNWDNPEYFRGSDTSDRLRNVGVPIFHLDGWYDFLLPNTYGNYKNISANAKDASVASNQRLLIGPWGHGPACTACAANADVDLPAMRMAWMDRWFKGKKHPLFDYPVILYVMGENRWRAEDSWPLPGTQLTRYYLHSQGKANTAGGDGVLSNSPPDKELSDHYTYDPSNPASTMGWELTYGERTEQNATEARPDVLVFTSPRLTEDVEVTGEVSAMLYAASSAMDTDWWVKLLDVAPEGKAYILTQGLARARYRISRTEPRALTPGKIEKYAINMRATSNVFKKGHQIRVEVTSSNFPYTDRNPNAFVDLSRATEKDFVLASQTIYHDANHPSHVELPIIPQSRERNWIKTPFPRAAASTP
jgi:uncharacterized protein